MPLVAAAGAAWRRGGRRGDDSAESAFAAARRHAGPAAAAPHDDDDPRWGVGLAIEGPRRDAGSGGAGSPSCRRPLVTAQEERQAAPQTTLVVVLRPLCCGGCAEVMEVVRRNAAVMSFDEFDESAGVGTSSPEAESAFSFCQEVCCWPARAAAVGRKAGNMLGWGGTKNEVRRSGNEVAYDYFVPRQSPLVSPKPHSGNSLDEELCGSRAHIFRCRCA